MRIGIDIDDVITNTSNVIKEYIRKQKNSEKLKEHMVEIMKGVSANPDVVQFGLENYIKIFQEVKVKENAKQVIQRLLEKGNEIYLITARGEDLEFFKGSEKVTINFLKDNDINYTKIIFNAINKAQLCKNNYIDLMIDDSIAHCEDVKNVGIKSIVFTSEVNKKIDTTVERINDWLQLEKRIEDMQEDCI